mgnify:CR=1 FL=1
MDDHPVCTGIEHDDCVNATMSGGAQQIMTHIDFAVEDLEEAVAWAVDAGATLAEYQPQKHVRVMLDPAGRPFCRFPGQA